MLESLLLDRIAAAIAEAVGRRVRIQATSSVGGGCIHAAYRLDSDAGPWFVKLGRESAWAAFDAEAAGLRELDASGAVRVPRPLAVGGGGGQSFLVLEFLSLRSATPSAQVELGRNLARLHRASQPYFGWHRDNAIGGTPQPNPPSSDWVAFYRDQRLGHQLRLAAERGYGGALQRGGESLRERLQAFFPDPPPRPSLLHGDLWGGNQAALDDGTPVLYDPACYYGDREADLAMTELFGGFGPGFYAAYTEELPLDAGYAVRRELYNLYHLLNHLNLFGAGYRVQAERVIGRLLAELG